MNYFNTAEISLEPGLKYNKNYSSRYKERLRSFDSWAKKLHIDMKFVHFVCQTHHLHGIMAKVLSSCCTLAHPRMPGDFIFWRAASLWPQCTMVEASAFLKFRFLAHTLILTRPQRSLRFQNICYKTKWYICRISVHDTQVSYGLSHSVNFIENIHKRHPIARSWGRGVGCLLGF